MSSNSLSREEMMIHEFPKAQSDKAGLRFVFGCYPSASKMPVPLDFLKTEGDVPRGRGGSTSGFIHYSALQKPLKEVARIRACYRTLRKRILIRLSYIPGLPTQNKAIDDLFDAYIPYVRLHDASQVSEFLRPIAAEYVPKKVTLCEVNPSKLRVLHKPKLYCI